MMVSPSIGGNGRGLSKHGLGDSRQISAITHGKRLWQNVYYTIRDERDQKINNLEQTNNPAFFNI
ncbi:hypothetical protein AZA_79401 [Nitrospirillum viridazoti Y2]|nr:hypothetical protein AZA_79401 [Nitrospirillum amazonense Y2]